MQCILDKENDVFDPLSRISDLKHWDFYYKTLTAYHQADEELQSLLGSNFGLELRLMKVYGTKSQLIRDVFMGIVGPYVTKKFQNEAFHLVYHLSHAGIKTTQKFLKQKCVRKIMSKD